MNNSWPSLKISWPDSSGLPLQTMATRHLGPRSPDDFAELCFADPSGQPLRQAAVHRDLQAFLTRHRFALVELPRDHGKSVQACVRALWELGRDPSLRIKIVCASDALAAERGRFLREAIAHNPWVRLAFPGLRPGRPWTETRFTVRRPADVIGPSVTALGVGAASTGSRADLLLCDDIVDVRALRSRADRERVTAFFHENLLNLLEPGGRFWGLFTPWHADDLNARLKANPAYAVFRRPVGDDLEPVWPEKWPRERLEERRRQIGAAAFARAYRLVCVPEAAAAVRGEWLRCWLEPAACSPVVLSVDPAVSCREGADRSALVVLGRTPANEIHCLEAVARRVPAPELLDLIDALDRRWRPDVILFESNAAFLGMKDLLARQARFGPKVKGVAQTKDKASRVSAFSVSVENGTFRLRGSGPHQVHPGQQALCDEMLTFPHGEHDDLLDAAATGTAYLLDRPEPRVW